MSRGMSIIDVLLSVHRAILDIAMEWRSGEAKPYLDLSHALGTVDIYRMYIMPLDGLWLTRETGCVYGETQLFTCIQMQCTVSWNEPF